MTNLSKYRKISITAMIIMVVAIIFTFASLWNSLLSAEVKHEGWIILFILLVFVLGMFLFYIAFISTDVARIEKVRIEAYESGKSEILKEIELKKQEETKQKSVSEDTQKITDAILNGLQNLRSENSLCNKLLINLARELGFVQGIIYIRSKTEGLYNPVGEYALTDRKPQPFKDNEGLPGQVALSKSMMVLYDIPENYFIVSSGLGSTQQGFLIIAPVVIKNECIAVLELASFKKPDESTGKILESVIAEVGHKLNKFITA